MAVMMLTLNISGVFASVNNKDDILDVIKSSNLLSIHKIESNDNGNISSKRINLNSKNFTLSDGDYVMDRGTGWVLGNDESFVKSGFAIPNQTLTIKEAKSSYSKFNTIDGYSGEIDFVYFKTSIERTFEKEFKETNSIETSFTLTAPSDKNVYAKTYTTYKKYEFIRVKNGKIVNRSEALEPDGTWAKSVEYKPGQTIDQNTLVEKTTRCVLSQEKPSVDVRASIDVNRVAASSYKKAFTIGFDINSKSILVSNKSNSPMHESTGMADKTYLTIKVLDKNKKEKLSLVYRGKDSPAHSRYNILDSFKFDIGDYIEFRDLSRGVIDPKGYIIGTPEDPYNRLYKITEKGLEADGRGSTIDVYGNNWGNEFLSFTLNIDLHTRRLNLLNTNNTQIHPQEPYRYDRHVQIRILDGFKREIKSVSLHGLNSSGNVSEHITYNFNTLNNFYVPEFGYIEIDNLDPSRMRNHLPIIGNDISNKRYQLYKISKDGLISQ